jgi:hypothetical protein
MTVNVVHTSEYRNNDYLSNVIGATAAGSGAGFASKYLLPLTKAELGDLKLQPKLTKDVFEKTIQLKHIRPVMQFVAAGSAVGFVAGVAHNVFRTEVKA